MENALFPLWAAAYLVSGTLAAQAAILAGPRADPTGEPHPERVGTFVAGAVAFLAATWTDSPAAATGAISAAFLYVVLWTVTQPAWHGLVFERLGEVVLPYLAGIPGVRGVVLSRIEPRLPWIDQANRSRWVRLLAVLGGSRARRALEGRLGDRFQTVRGEALQALAGLGGEIDPDRLRRTLERDLDHASLGVRVQAVEALREMGGSVSNAVGPGGELSWLPARPEPCRMHRATGLLVPGSSLERPVDGSADPAARFAALLALAESETSPEGVARLRAALDDPCGDCVHAAIRILATWSVGEAASDLDRLAGDHRLPERLRAEASRAALEVRLATSDPAPLDDRARLLDFFQAHAQWDAALDGALLADLAALAGRSFESTREFLDWVGHPAARLFDPPEGPGLPGGPPASASRAALLAALTWPGAAPLGAALGPSWARGIYVPILFPIAMGAALAAWGRWAVRRAVTGPAVTRGVMVAAAAPLLATMAALGGGLPDLGLEGRGPAHSALLVLDLSLLALVAQASPARAAARPACPRDGTRLVERVVLEPGVLDAPSAVDEVREGRDPEDLGRPGRYRNDRTAVASAFDCPRCARTLLHRFRFPRRSGIPERVIWSACP